MTVITVSRNELTRLRVLIDIGDGRLSVEDATGLIGVGRRQIYRLLLMERGICFHVLTGQGADIDTTTASGRLVFGIFAALPSSSAS
jgi:hypothetical protein